MMLKSFMSENLLSLLGLGVKWWPWLCLSSFGMAGVWSTIYHRGLCWPNCASELWYTHRTCLFTVSVCVFVFICLCVWEVTQTASQTLDTSVIQSSGSAQIQDWSSSLSLWRAIPSLRPLLTLSCFTSGGRGKREQNTDYVFICSLAAGKKAEYFLYHNCIQYNCAKAFIYIYI